MRWASGKTGGYQDPVAASLPVVFPPPFVVSAFLVDPGVGHVGDLDYERQVVAAEAVGRFPLLAVLVQALEGHNEAKTELASAR